MAVLLLVRFLVFPDTTNAPDWEKTLATVLDNLFAASVTSLAIGLAYVLLFPTPEAEQIEIIQSRDICEVIELATRQCATWDVRARTASYFARVTLPQLRDGALRTGRAAKIRVQVLDPGNDEILAHYARYRSNRPGAAASWTLDRARVEIYSTVLAVALANAEAPRLELKIGFSPDFWVLSLDLNDEWALVTGQNKDEPAMCVRKASPLYSGWREDFEAGFSMCRVVEPRLQQFAPLEMTGASQDIGQKLNAFFGLLDLPALNDEQMGEVVAYAERHHNYA